VVAVTNHELLYERLEPWAVDVARRVAARCGIRRWADDLEQEARVALWQALQAYDLARHDDAERFVRWKFQLLFKSALKRYVQWDAHETQLDFQLFE
jgi:DNA-directed RNA polymerase specialized sigma24 family protein